MKSTIKKNDDDDQIYKDVVKAIRECLGIKGVKKFVSIPLQDRIAKVLSQRHKLNDYDSRELYKMLPKKWL